MRCFQGEAQAAERGCGPRGLTVSPDRASQELRGGDWGGAAQHHVSICNCGEGLRGRDGGGCEIDADARGSQWESDAEMLVKGGCCHNLRLLFVVCLSLGDTGQGSAHSRVCCGVDS